MLNKVLRANLKMSSKAHNKIQIELDGQLKLEGPPAIDTEKTILLLFKFLQQKPLKGYKLDNFSDGVIEAFETEDYLHLSNKIEVFIKALILLINREKYEEMVNERDDKGGHLNMLSAFAIEAGLKEHKKDSSGTADQGLTHFHIGRYWKTLNKSRNSSGHEAEELTSRDKAIKFEAACVIYTWLIDRYSEQIKLRILCEKHKDYLSAIDEQFSVINDSYVDTTIEELQKENAGEKFKPNSDDERITVSFDADTLYSRYDSSLLRGEPGAGKTTTLQRICLKNLEGLRTGNYSDYYFPIFVRLNELGYIRDAGIMSLNIYFSF